MMTEKMRQSLGQRVAPTSTALLVIDVQNDFCAKGGYYDKIGADVVGAEPSMDRLVAFIDQARSAGVRVIFVRCDYDPVYVSETQNSRHKRQGSNIAYCRPGTWGFEFFKVAPKPDELIVTKHRYDAFHGTDLEVILRANKITSLLFTGVATNVCVESSLRTAYMRDFESTLVADCCAGRTVALHEGTLENVRRHFGVVANAEDVVDAWSDHSQRPRRAAGA